MGTMTLETLPGLVGQELGVSSWLTIEQAQIDAFAQCTGDHQWIHVDVERSRRGSPFGTTIAHGYLVLSLIAPLAMEIGIVPVDAAAGLNYGFDKVRFLAPVKVGARVRLRATLVSAGLKAGGMVLKTSNTLEIEGSDKPAFVAEALSLLIPGKAAGTGAAS